MGRGPAGILTFPPFSELAISGFRWLEYLGLLGFIGVLVVRRLAANPPSLSWARLPMHYVLAVAFVGGVGAVVARVVLWGNAEAAASYVFGGPDGWARVGRIGAEGLALAFCLARVRFVVAPGLLAAVLLAFAGHAARVQPQAAGVAADALHIFSAGMWAGGIVALATLKPPGGWRNGDGRMLLDRFSRVAPLAFAITALTGLLRATEELASVSDLWTSSYGLVLSLKSIGVLAMLVLSWLAWHRGLPVARWEAVIALIVMLATAVLIAYPVTPGEASRIISTL